MAKCRFCGKVMSRAYGCTYKFIVFNEGKSVSVKERIKVGDEGWVEPGQRCGDCGALYGYYHHADCDIERCPKCGSQLYGCFCDIAYFVEKEEDID